VSTINNCLLIVLIRLEFKIIKEMDHILSTIKAVHLIMSQIASLDLLLIRNLLFILIKLMEMQSDNKLGIKMMILLNLVFVQKGYEGC